jgi:hypothetical protein
MKIFTKKTITKKTMHAASFFSFLGYTNLYPLAFYTGKLFFLFVCVSFLVDIIHHSLFCVCVCVCVYIWVRGYLFFLCFILTHCANTHTTAAICCCCYCLMIFLFVFSTVKQAYSFSFKCFLSLYCYCLNY